MIYRDHVCYHSHRERPRNRERAWRFLAGGPWVWPRHDEDPDAYAYALDVYASTPPKPTVGEGLLVAVHEGRGELWVLPGPGGRAVGAGELVETAREAWRDAECALPRSLPVLWRSVREHTQHIPRPAELHPRQRADATLTGRSFGLAFALRNVSLIFGQPVPADLIASACVDELGQLGPVEGLEAKLRVVLDQAPSVRRFIVAKGQGDAAHQILDGLGQRGRLQIIEHERLGAAVAEVFPGLEGAMDRQSGTAEGRDQLVESFFRLAMGERVAAIDWSPVARSARHALESWGDRLDAEARQRLVFSAAVAERHDNNKGKLPLPDVAWLLRLPAPMRVSVLAHVTQQAADTGSPEPRGVLRLANEWIPNPHEAFPEHLRLLGARGRLHYSALGDVQMAMEDQLQALRGWQERWMYQEMSYPLSVLYLYVGVLAAEAPPQDTLAAERYAEAARFEEELLRGGASGRANAYVQLARGRALVELGRLDEARQALEPLVTMQHIATHVPWSALRWLLRACPPEARGAHLERLRRGAVEDHEARLMRDLVSLDEALRQGDVASARASFMTLYAQQEELCALLLRGAHLTPEDPRAPAFLARRYPY